ncbi:MAG: hypothetical protein ABIE43_00790 [Patescibacteria group bacterium]
MSKSKFIILSFFLLIIPLVIKAAQVPPEIPVLYYGEVKINSGDAPLNTTVSVLKVINNEEIASKKITTVGKYFIEMPCKNYLNEDIFFKVNDLIAGQSQCLDVMITPSKKLDLAVDSANVTTNQWTKEITIPESESADKQIKIEFSNKQQTASTTIVTIGTNGLALNRQSANPNNKFKVEFPANTKITGGLNWDGKLIVPTIKANSLVTIPAEQNKETIVEEVIEIGFGGSALTFDQPVSIIFPEMSGKRIGYSYGGSDFTEVINVCPTNNGDSLIGDITDCKYNSGDDLIVWTMHFTLFAVFSSTLIPPPAVSNGVGAPIPTTKCNQVNYGPWQNICVNNWQYRNIISQSPENCALTEEQIKASQKGCKLEEVEKEEGEKVLGKKIYADGFLIRGPNKRIYLIASQKKSHIVNLEALKKYAGKPIIDVTDEVLTAYEPGENIYGFKDGDLIRGSVKKVYIIRNGKREYIRNMEELKKYAGQMIYDVSDKVLGMYN